jgi:hypothetical protein
LGSLNKETAQRGYAGIGDVQVLSLTHLATAAMLSARYETATRLLPLT